MRSIDEYWAVRDHTGGCLPSFVFIEFVLDVELPEEVYLHPKMERLREIANRSIAGCNVSFLSFLSLFLNPPYLGSSR